MNNIYTVYETKNIVNQKIYVGIHKEKHNENVRKYLGSGKELLKDVKKYGKQNFVKTILHRFDNFREMRKMERNIVDLDFIQCEDTYNIALGGGGSVGLLTKETRRKMSNARIGTKHSKMTKSRMSKSSTGVNSPYFKGYYRLPNGYDYASLRLAGNEIGVSRTALGRLFQNLDKIVSNKMYTKNKFIQTFGTRKEIVGKTYREMGFEFISHRPLY